MNCASQGRDEKKNSISDKKNQAQTYTVLSFLSPRPIDLIPCHYFKAYLPRNHI